MATLVVQEGAPGFDPIFVAASATGDEYANNGSVLLLLDAVAARTLVVESPHAGLPDYELEFGPGGVICPRFDPIRWNDPTTGRVQIHFDDHVGVTVAAIRTSLIGFDPSTPVPGSLI